MVSPLFCAHNEAHVIFTVMTFKIKSANKNCRVLEYTLEFCKVFA